MAEDELDHLVAEYLEGEFVLERPGPCSVSAAFLQRQGAGDADSPWWGSHGGVRGLGGMGESRLRQGTAVTKRRKLSHLSDSERCDRFPPICGSTKSYL